MPVATPLRRVGRVTMHALQRKIPVDAPRLKRQVERIMREVDFAEYDVSVILSNNARLRELNRFHRGKDKATDILSFRNYYDMRPGIKPPRSEDDEMDIGSMFISVERALRDANEAQVPLHDHLLFLCVHGTLHLVGYDHETEEDRAVMDKRERAVLAALRAGEAL